MFGGERIETERVESYLTNVAGEASTDQGRESLGEAARESGVTLLHYYYPLSSFTIPSSPILSSPLPILSLSGGRGAVYAPSELLDNQSIRNIV